MPNGIALFLDVDNTLTEENIQETYAKHLECQPEYADIEVKFQSGSIGAAEFGERLVGLFASRGFNRRMAVELADSVRLRQGVHQLLTLPVDIFLVSSGPDYFVRPLGERFKVPIEQVMCSVYSFHRSGGVVSGCAAASDDARARFVRSNATKFTLSIGLGDSPVRDLPFLNACNIGLLTVPTEDHLCAPDLGSVEGLVRAVCGSLI